MYRLHTSQNLLMHSVIYRTEFLRECGLELPEHTFYVDNLFVYQPLAKVKRICYLNEDLYRYFIGREDQSVNEKVMMGRIDQQIKVTKLMIKAQRLSEIPSKKLSSYMVKYLAMMMTICTVFLIKIGDEESMRKKEEIKENLWFQLIYCISHKQQNSSIFYKFLLRMNAVCGREQKLTGGHCYEAERLAVSASFWVGNWLSGVISCVVPRTGNEDGSGMECHSSGAG
jgi:hypothetical protein